MKTYAESMRPGLAALFQEVDNGILKFCLKNSAAP